MISITFIVPTCGRPTLSRTLDSIASQIADGDEIIVICNKNAIWGNASRDKAMEMATTTHMAFIDDDDVYAEGALDIARRAVEEWPEHVHVFRMHSPKDNNPWNRKDFAPGQVGTPMVVWPRMGDYPRWAEDDSGISDYHFISKAQSGRPVMWHEEVLAVVRPE